MLGYNGCAISPKDSALNEIEGKKKKRQMLSNYKIV